MTQSERDAILGRTRREYREARAELGAVRKRHAELVSEVRELLSSIDQEPLRVYVSRDPRGALQTAIEAPKAHYLYSAPLAERLALDAMGKHLDEYRAISELVEDRRKSLIDQGEDDPGPADSFSSVRSSPVS
jgi:hypothetical protein